MYSLYAKPPSKNNTSAIFMVGNKFAEELKLSSCAVSAEERLRIDFKQECGYNGYEIER